MNIMINKNLLPKITNKDKEILPCSLYTNFQYIL
nr:MAG TPA: hypothetical protein [Microviridae sp.]